MERDPVCGMTVNPKKAAATSKYENKEYYFCSTTCKQQFDKNPAQYVGQTASQATRR